MNKSLNPIMNAPRALVLLPLVVVLAACGRAESPVVDTPPEPAVQAPAPEMADVALLSSSGSSVAGALQLAATPDGVTLAGEIRGLQPDSIHGFHFHEVGDCSAPDASSAGAHFNPTQSEHGGPTSGTKHLGDLPNLAADANGVAAVQVVVPGATLRDAGAHDLVGRALVVHEKADDYTTQPSGDSGSRIACGVVR